ncbi:hypothetical protein BC629DRAFT_455283 [Irpex lacteus]|nr:hypothetical protein BC629DRAFT_455283 [Irpex lacteus]
MRSVTTIVAFVLVMAIAVLPALSNPLLPVGPNGRPFRIGVPINRLPTVARRDLRMAKRVLDSHCLGPITNWPAECFDANHQHPPDLSGNTVLQLRNAKRIINLHCSGDPATIPADCFNNDAAPKPVGGLLGHIPLSIKTPTTIGKRIIDLRCSGLTSQIPADCQNRPAPKPVFPGGPIALQLRALAEMLV